MTAPILAIWRRTSHPSRDQGLLGDHEPPWSWEVGIPFTADRHPHRVMTLIRRPRVYGHAHTWEAALAIGLAVLANHRRNSL